MYISGLWDTALVVAREPIPVRSKADQLSRAKAVIAKLMQELADLKAVDAARLLYPLRRKRKERETLF